VKTVSDKNGDKRVALKMVMGDKVRDVTFEELAITNNLAHRALVSLLVRKGIIDPKEFLEELKKGPVIT